MTMLVQADLEAMNKNQVKRKNEDLKLQAAEKQVEDLKNTKKNL